MADTTYEEAKRCPKCKQPGELHKEESTPRGKVHFFTCRNERCTWNGTDWLVQTRPDGTIPDRRFEHQEKAFPTISDSMMAVGRRNTEDAVQRDLRDSENLRENG